MTNQTYKVVLTGNSGVGKSTFLKRHLTGEFETSYIPTLGVDNHKLTFRTNYGPVVFNVWDTAGQEKFSGLREGYATDTDAVIGMFDIGNKTSLKHLDQWLQMMKGGQVPTVVCGNKVDLTDHSVKVGDKVKVAKKWGTYYDVSAKSNYNYEKPFLKLARMLTGHNDLEFTAEPVE